MKVTIDGKRYNTDKCEVLGEIEHNTMDGSYGTTRLIRASDGKLLVWFDSKGWEIFPRSYVSEWSRCLYKIDDFTLTDKQEARCVSLGLIEIVD